MCAIAESILQDDVTDDQYVLAVASFRGEHWNTDEPMALEELNAWIGRPDLKTPMSQILEGTLGDWFGFGCCDGLRQRVSRRG